MLYGMLKDAAPNSKRHPDNGTCVLCARQIDRYANMDAVHEHQQRNSGSSSLQRKPFLFQGFDDSDDDSAAIAC